MEQQSNFPGQHPVGIGALYGGADIGTIYEAEAKKIGTVDTSNDVFVEYLVKSASEVLAQGDNEKIGKTFNNLLIHYQANTSETCGAKLVSTMTEFAGYAAKNDKTGDFKNSLVKAIDSTEKNLHSHKKSHLVAPITGVKLALVRK